MLKCRNQWLLCDNYVTRLSYELWMFDNRLSLHSKANISLKRPLTVTKLSPFIHILYIVYECMCEFLISYYWVLPTDGFLCSFCIVLERRLSEMNSSNSPKFSSERIQNTFRLLCAIKGVRRRKLVHLKRRNAIGIIFVVKWRPTGQLVIEFSPALQLRWL